MRLPGRELSHLLVAREGWMLLALVDGVETRFCVGEKRGGISIFPCNKVSRMVFALPIFRLVRIVSFLSNMLAPLEVGDDMDAKVVCTAAFFNRLGPPKLACSSRAIWPVSTSYWRFLSSSFIS